MGQASHGVVPDLTIVAKNQFEDIKVVIDGNTHFLSCIAKTQADY